MFGHQYNHGVIRKYIIMFGNMFNDITVTRTDNNNSRIQAIRVPIAYGPKEKFLARLRQDPQLNRQVATQLPRLSFEITNMSYSPNRSLNKMSKNVSVGAGNRTLARQFTPVPYDINVSLYGMFSFQEDAVQVVEQILPFFRPEWTNSMKLVNEMGQYYDIPTVLEGMTIEDTYDSDFQTRRAIIYTFNFMIKGYIFGPVQNKGIIKRTIVNSYDNESYDPTIPKIHTTTLTPGLTSSGTPTGNTSQSVPITTIDAEDDYGFAFEREDFFNGTGE
jgi:hypothetical protein